MILNATCPGCRRPFPCLSQDVPAQRFVARRSRDRVIAYYPTCPHCGTRAEVANPAVVRPYAAR